MNDEDSNFNLFYSSEETTHSSQIIIDEMNNFTINQNLVTMIAEDVNIFPSLPSINEDEISIQLDNSQPLQVFNSPIVINVGQNITDYDYIWYDITLNHEREAVAEPVQNADDEIQILHTESVPIQIAESPAQLVPIDDEIQEYPIAHIDTIGLTQGNDSPVTLTPSVAAPSLEVTGQNSIIASAIDNTKETINICAKIQIPLLSSRTNKRSNSLDAVHQAEKTCILRPVKRRRKLIS
ncbi:unnamed protein product [Rotaria sordida]|uniref:Uncharacterized protein n=1 Tax=Rotaria sordida TaxID=392033 RepID=A0A815WYI5_9BILA|nr:unnamed protein product [Rotaria sordida]CAF4048759.1 unnamed protein product [Rotaria sordida]